MDDVNKCPLPFRSRQLFFWLNTKTTKVGSFFFSVIGNSKLELTCSVNKNDYEYVSSVLLLEVNEQLHTHIMLL